MKFIQAQVGTEKVIPLGNPSTTTIPMGRTNFALNLYPEEGETYVDFAKGSDEYEKRFKALTERFIDKVTEHKRAVVGNLNDINKEYSKKWLCKYQKMA